MGQFLAKILADLKIIQNSHRTNNPTLEAIATANSEEDKLKTAQQAQQEAEERLRKGVQPVVLPTTEEVAAAKAKVQYQDSLFHFAVAGVAGSGKSSLVNAIRGLRNSDTGAAPTGVVETTATVGRYRDSNRRLLFVWYDIPGTGTLNQPGWQYFNNQGLFVFDCIIVLVGDRFTQTDLAILENCRRFQIPSYIVRSKADFHIPNLMSDMGYDSDDDDESQYETMYNAARERYISDTQATVQQNLGDAKLPMQKVYLVSNKVLLSAVKKRTLPKTALDEMELLKDLLEEACARRCVAPEDESEA
ncbi:interferon-inducible GTPase-domain-containing protein [Pisolithus croceorrhizus]|nr:interferon-inducible GTPase-domain-containing protein [Pisolithus croceorrhizus]KAI6159857.1 interferon-inducible GTPase-domain-containing protein [Pisolithus thermaeus]